MDPRWWTHMTERDHRTGCRGHLPDHQPVYYDFVGIMNLGIETIVFATKKNHLLTNVAFYLQIHWRKNFECYERHKQFISDVLKWTLNDNLINHQTGNQTKPPPVKTPPPALPGVMGRAHALKSDRLGPESLPVTGAWASDSERPHSASSP